MTQALLRRVDASSLLSYTKSIRALLPSLHSADHSSSFVLVLGNEASDADSMVSSVVYAFASFRASSRAVFVPVMNIPRNEAILRPEALRLFHAAHIQPSDLLFLDDVPLDRLFPAPPAPSPAPGVVLVDHNRLSIRQEFLAPHVVGVVDHHKDEGLFEGEQLVLDNVVEKTGSTCSLVARLVEQRVPDLFVQVPGVAVMLLGTILLDTGNMNPQLKKGTELDAHCIDVLREAALLVQKQQQGQDVPLPLDELTSLYEELFRMRTDCSGLTTPQLLVRDTKYVRAGDLLCGVAGVTQRLEAWVQEDAAFPRYVREFAASRDLGLAAVMTVSTHPETSDLQRQLYFQFVGDNGAELAAALDKLLLEESGLQLESLGEHDAFKELLGPAERVYEQAKLDASRKQVLPILHSLMSRL